MTDLVFPPGFLWGAATAAHQVEGGNANDWTRFEAKPGTIERGETSAVGAGGRSKDKACLLQLDLQPLPDGDGLQLLRSMRAAKLETPVIMMSGHATIDVAVQATRLGALNFLEKPLNPDKFFPWIQDLVAKDGPNILRCKGILSFKDDPERFVFQGVHMILDGDHQRAWRAGEKRESRIVFIGRNLPEEKIRAGFESCVA